MATYEQLLGQLHTIQSYPDPDEAPRTVTLSLYRTLRALGFPQDTGDAILSNPMALESFIQEIEDKVHPRTSDITEIGLDKAVELLKNMGINLDYFMYEGGTGSLQAQIIARQPDAVRAIEKHYNLPITGDYKMMMRNYNYEYYTRKCRKSNSALECLTRAAKQQFLADVVKYLAEEDESWHTANIFDDPIFDIIMTAAFRGYREIMAVVLKDRNLDFIGAVLVGAAASSDYTLLQETFAFFQHATIDTQIYDQSVTVAMLAATMFDKLANLQLLQQESLFHESVNPQTTIVRSNVISWLNWLKQDSSGEMLAHAHPADYFIPENLQMTQLFEGNFRSVELLRIAIDEHSVDTFHYLMLDFPQAQSAIFKYATEAAFFHAILYLTPTYVDLPNFLDDINFMFDKLSQFETPQSVTFFQQFIELNVFAPAQLFDIIVKRGQPTTLAYFLKKHPSILADIPDVKSSLNGANDKNFIFMLEQYSPLRQLFSEDDIMAKIILSRFYVPTRGTALAQFYPEFFRVRLYAILHMEDYDQAVQLIKHKLRSGTIFRYIDLPSGVLKRSILDIMKMLVDQNRFDLVIEMPFLYRTTDWGNSEQLFDFHYNDNSSKIIEYTAQQGKSDALPYLFSNSIGDETGKFTMIQHKTVLALAIELGFYNDETKIWSVPSIRDVLKHAFETEDVETMIWALRRLNVFMSRPLLTDYTITAPPSTFADFTRSIELISVYH